MKIAILSPVAWRTPPRHYGPWELVASTIAEGLFEKGYDVTLFATKDSVTRGKLSAVIPQGYEEDKTQDAKVAECLHISHLMEKAGDFDIIHNHFDFLPLTYSNLIKTPMVTTIHGFSSKKIIEVYRKYNDSSYYVSISNADRSDQLRYLATVYNGIDPSAFTFNQSPEDYLLFFGRIHHDKGCLEAIEIAKRSNHGLIISGIIQDQNYYREKIFPLIDDDRIKYIGVSDPEQRDQVMGSAKALLHPINFEEPFGLSVVESMFCGTPVIAFNKGSMGELIDDGQSGFLVHTVNEAVEKVKDINKLSRKNCRAWAEENFSKERMINGYIKVYERILDSQH